MISRDCDGCGQIHICIRMFQRVGLGDKVYCPTGERHLIDSGSLQGFL